MARRRASFGASHRGSSTTALSTGPGLGAEESQRRKDVVVELDALRGLTLAILLCMRRWRVCRAHHSIVSAIAGLPGYWEIILPLRSRDKLVLLRYLHITQISLLASDSCAEMRCL